MHTFPHSKSVSELHGIISYRWPLPPTMHCVCAAPNAGLSLWMQRLGLLQPRTHWLFMCFILLNPRGFINIDWRQKMDGVQAQGIKSISLTSPRPHTTLHKLLLICVFSSHFISCLSFLLVTFPAGFWRPLCWFHSFMLHYKRYVLWVYSYHW